MIHINTGHHWSTKHEHDTVAEARDCEAYTRHMDSEPPSCPICDAVGCGGAQGRGCDRYERGSLRDQYGEDDFDYAWADAQFPGITGSAS